MDSQYFYNTQGAGSIQKELNSKYQIASKELQNLYKRSIMIEPLLEMLEDIYSKEDEGSAIAPLSLSINQIKLLNADIKTCLLNVKEKKSGPFQRIIKTKGENFDALESRMDKLIRDLEVALSTAEQAAKENSEKRKLNKNKINNNKNNNNNTQANKQKQNAQPTKYSLTDNYQDYYNTTENYTNNYSYNNNTSNYNYKEPANYNNYLSDNNNNNNNELSSCSLNTSLTKEFAQMNINLEEDTSENKPEPKTETSQMNDQSNYTSNQYSNGPTINIQPPNYQESQNTYNNYSNDQLYNNYSSPSQQYYYGTLTKNNQQNQQQSQQSQQSQQTQQSQQPQQSQQSQQSQQQMNYNQQQQTQQQMNYNQQQSQQQMNYNQQQGNNYNQQQQMNYNQQQMYYQQPVNNYQDMNNYNNNYNNNQYQQPMMNYDNNQMQQPMAVAQTQISSSEATTMEGDSLINQKGLIPPTPYYAISSFTPRQLDELAIEQGDEVIIVQTFDDGWAFGRNSRTRKVGVLPMTFLSYSNQYSNNNNVNNNNNNYEYSTELPDRQSSRRL